MDLLGLFGYDPLKYVIGRGVLEASGIGFEVGPKDVAIRCNFVTLDAAGNITNRRGGSGATDRLTNDEMIPRVEKLRKVSIPGVELLAGESKANGLTMRGFAVKPDLPTYKEVYGVRAAAIAAYPIYKGLARLVGMEIVGEPGTLEEEIDVLEQSFGEYDFFFVHFKYTDSRGEDGNFEAKVEVTEQFDAIVPRVEALNPDVLLVTGDHSTPAALRSHSWHPVPTLLVADTCRPDGCRQFGEKAALSGGLGHFEAVYLMPLALAHAGRLGKFGA